MLRRLLVLMMIMLMLPVISLADEITPYEVFTFSASLPERLKEPLAAFIPDETQIISGASIQHNGSHYDDSPSELDSYTAMVLVSTDSGPCLYAAAWVENLPWQVNDYTRFLRQKQDVCVSIYRPDDFRAPILSVDYSVQNGIKSDLFIFRSNMLWCIDGHIDEDRGVTVRSTYPESIELTDSRGSNAYYCCAPFYLDYMTDISAYPITREAAEAQAIAYETAIATDASVNRVYSSGAHLRKEPTGKSESLGVYAHNVPMNFTGEQKPGTTFPWFQVRIGDTLGWTSSNYVNASPDIAFAPIPLGRTLEGCQLYASTNDKEPTAELAPGTTFHILTEYDGMYHICIPQGELAWAVDPDGTYGYISTSNVLTGYSPSSLDAQQNAQ